MNTRSKSGTTPGGRRYEAQRTKTKGGEVNKSTIVTSPLGKKQQYNTSHVKITSAGGKPIKFKNDKAVDKGPTRKAKAKK